MSLEHPYTTLEDVQAELKNHSDDAVQKIKDAINLASRAIEDYCNRDFLFHDYSEGAYVVPPDDVYAGQIVLPWPIVTLDSITYDGTELDEDDYSYTVGKRIILVENDYTVGMTIRSKLEITGSFGWVEDVENPETAPPPTLPQSLRRACTLIAAAWSGEMRKEQVGLDGSRVSILDNRIPDEAKKLLKRFKRHAV